MFDRQLKISDIIATLALVVSVITAYEQVKLQRRATALESQFVVVLGLNTDKNLEANLSNGQNVNFSFSNGSKLAVSYKVDVRTEGVGVFWPNQTPDKMYYRLNFDRRPVLLQPLDRYTANFNVWIGNPTSSNAKITIYVNDEPQVGYEYIFDDAKKMYVFKSSF